MGTTSNLYTLLRLLAIFHSTTITDARITMYYLPLLAL